MNATALERAQRAGRRLGTGLFALLFGGFTVVCSAQVLLQGFSSPKGSTVTDCRSGLLRLVSSLQRARQAAAEATEGERIRLEQFRSSLLPEWQDRDSLKRMCASDQWSRNALSEIDRLRWAEEHAVRYESVELASGRQRVLLLEQALRRQAEPSP